MTNIEKIKKYISDKKEYLQNNTITDSIHHVSINGQVLNLLEGIETYIDLVEKNSVIDNLNQIILELKQKGVVRENEISDGYHTFDDLYEFRKLYNALLFNEWAKNGRIEVYKSRRHYDGEECFGGGWFIVVAMLPTGQISNHYKLQDWDLFDIPEYQTSKYEFDGHTPYDVMDRMRWLLYNEKSDENE